MLGLLTQFGESSSGIGALGLNLQSLIIQLLTFIIAFLVLRKWAFKPILKMLDERRKTIEKGVSLGEQMQKDKAEMDAKVDSALREARSQADKVLADAHDAGRQAVAEAEESARKKTEGILAAAEERIKQDTTLARRKLEKDLAALVADATEAIIQEKVDSKKDAELVDRAIKGVQA